MTESSAVSNRAMSWGTIVQSFRDTEDTPLLSHSENSNSSAIKYSKQDIWSHRWIPANIEDDNRRTTIVEPIHPARRRSSFHRRSIRRRIFLFLTDPTSSYASLIFFVIVIIAIAAINIIMFMQTMDQYQFVPDDCVSCGGNKYYVLEDDNFSIEPGTPCVCPPAPLPSTVKAADYIVYFFTIEWSLRVLFFEPPPSERAHSCWGFFCQWLGFLTDTTTILDALAIFPYYAERFEKTNGLMSLRLLRLFRVFQLVRLGQYNQSFMSLTNVLYRSTLYLKLLVVVLLFGAAFFGSILYWMEKGDWKYYKETGTYEFLRLSVDGLKEEPSPFTSIPVAFWWFLVTATTVGYGDMYPTTVGGRCVAALAMLMGVLVIAFPVSVFSDLWQNELKGRGVDYEELLEDDDGDDDETDETLKNNEITRSVRFASDELSDVSSTDGLVPGGSNTASLRLTSRTNETSAILEDSVMFDAEDVAALRKHVKVMEKSHERIKAILAKYDIDEI